MSGGVKPSQLARAKDLFERFTGHGAKGLTIKAPIAPKVAIVVGFCDALEYTTEREGRIERYRHRFAKADRPILCAGPTRKDGTFQLILLEGNYRFTDHGIVDASDKRNAHLR